MINYCWVHKMSHTFDPFFLQFGSGILKLEFGCFNSALGLPHKNKFTSESHANST